MSDGNSAYEMQTHPSTSGSTLRPPPTNRQRSASGSNVMSEGNGFSSTSGRAMGTVDFSNDEGGMDGGRNSSSSMGKSHKMGEGFKRRFGSLRRSLKGGDN